MSNQKMPEINPTTLIATVIVDPRLPLRTRLDIIEFLLKIQIAHGQELDINMPILDLRPPQAPLDKLY